MDNRSVLLIASLAVLVACNGGGSSGGGTSGNTGGGVTTPPPVSSLFKSGSITADQFVTALNTLELGGANESYVQLYEDEVIRSYVPGEDQWFVIWDDKHDEYKAISLRYIRTLTYLDYMSSDRGTAQEFRDEENWDLRLGFGNYLNGDYWGDDYEVVDYDSVTGIFTGRNSGMEYEDEILSTDVSLAQAEYEQSKFFETAARLSVAYNVSIEASLSLVSLAEKTEQLLARSGRELTRADELAFASDLQKLSGATLSEVMAATQSTESKRLLVEKIARKIGTSSANLETRILPELFGVSL